MEKLHAGEVRGWAFSPPPFSPPPSLSLQLEEMCREQQASLGNGHGDLVEATASNLVGDAEGPGAQRALGSPGPQPGVCAKIKIKNWKKKESEVRLPRAGGRTGDCGMWSRGGGVVSGGKEIFFFS